jgi:hypothetical protein
LSYGRKLAFHLQSFHGIHRGFIGHSLTGLVGGALSGAFLQEAAVSIVAGSGSQNSSTASEIAVTHLLAGGVAGAILMLAIGFLKASDSSGPPKA